MFESIERSYQGKKVFLTGHTGFKGSWLLKMLSLLGAQVKGYALAPVNEFDLYNVIKGDRLCDSVIADLRDRKRLIEEIKNFQPDFVFHLAAQPLVRISYDIPAETFEINAIGTANLLDGVRALEKPCQAVLITTDKVYHNNEWFYPYRESDRLGGYDPYSASKACAELVIDSYRNSFFNVSDYDKHYKSITVARAGNVIGGGDWAKDRLIPDIVRFLSKNEKIIVRNPNAVRPWQHVLEPLFGYLLLGSKMLVEPVKYSGAYNFGPGVDDALPVNKMVELAIKSWGKGEFEVINSANQPHEAGLLKLDISKAAANLNWKPKYQAPEAIEKTIEWYKYYFSDSNKIEEFTERQIIDFINE
ncbi:CDP-glucose 4,6-dehydratase [Mucilaginibacter sp.]|uniref:CDP-glucose 4,6-dehydratase n=1 Tax=Mucilaginibacter sp. TaxID=1882438 RepID=UPI00284D6D2D|nr:CDP-glucose 4,6-dehydratase [Mucilaginibacter sp.]MDR3696340.1 CDP-glucose 4,6-dehydratase [Mucilaginibacter sp.]